MQPAPTSSPEIALIQSRFRYRPGRFRILLPRILSWAAIVVVGAAAVLAFIHSFWWQPSPQWCESCNWNQPYHP
jgi:hypothetical protein